MAEDRRSARRARLSAVRATYEGATGERRDAEVLDLSREGVFLKCETPLAVGKRLSLEIHVTGEPAPWPALGRVVWARASAESDGRPAGMAVKLIDVEESVCEAIDRLVLTREPTDRGLGARRTPPREKTILGVGTNPAPETPSPDAAVASVIVAEEFLSPFPADAARDGATPDRPASDRPTPIVSTKEPSIAIDLVPKRSEADDPADGASAAGAPPGVATAPGAHQGFGDARDRPHHESPPARAAVPARAATTVRATVRLSSERPVGKRRARRGVAVFFILAIAALVGYAYRDLLFELWGRALPELNRLLGH